MIFLHRGTCLVSHSRRRGRRRLTGTVLDLKTGFQQSCAARFQDLGSADILGSISAKKPWVQSVHQTERQWKFSSHAYSHGLPPNHCRKQHHHLLQEPGLASLHGSGKSTGETELGAVAVDAVSGVQVLNDHDLEAGSATLAGSNHGPCKEEFPNLQEVVSKKKLYQF